MLKTKVLNKTMTTTLIILLTLPMLFAVLPRASATSLTATCVPGFGPVGTTVTITGGGASAGGSIYVYWENTGGALLNSTAYANGAGAYSVKATIPAAVGGGHFLIVKDVSTGTTVGVSFTITTTLTLTPTSGIRDDSIAVAGTGFAATSNVSIFFDYPAIRFRSVGTASAAWAASPGSGRGPYSANLTSLDGGLNEAKVSVYINTTTSAFTLGAFNPNVLAFDYWLVTGTTIPDLELRFLAFNCSNPDDELSLVRGHADFTLTGFGAGTTGAWTNFAGMTTGSSADCFWNDPATGVGASSTGTTFATERTALLTAIPDATNWRLEIVSVQVGWTVAVKCYADNVKVGTPVYNLEPGNATVAASALGAFTSSFIVPNQAYNQYTVSAVDTAGFNATAPFTIGAAITLTPTTGPTGTVATIAGRGFNTAIHTVVITVDGSTVQQVAPILTLADGTFTGQFIIPTLTTIGLNKVVSATDATKTATALFNVTGNTTITLTPTTGTVGTVVTIQGANFTAIAGKTVTVTFSTITVATLSTNATGGFSGTFTVPSLAASPPTYTVNATDANFLNATAPFIIAVTFLGISPIKGPTGTVATVTGYGFATSGGTANVTIGTLRVLTNILDTDLVAGTTTFNVPTLPVGTYTVTALDTGLLTASTNYEVNVTTALTLNSSSAIAGAIVLLDASSFAISQALTFTFKNATYTQALTLTYATGWSDQMTNGTGYYKGTFPVPTVAIGSYTINATDAHGCTVEVPFSVVPAVATITLDPIQSLIGAVVGVVGNTFTANRAVNIYFGSTLVKTVNSTSDGHLPLNVNFTVPDVSYGTYTVNASDGVTSATATFNVLGVHGIDIIQAIVTAIEAKLDTYGSFWNFTNTWFTTISNKLGVFTGADTVASLLYSIKTAVSAINWTDITAIKAKTDTINWADITSIKSTTSLSIDYLWGLQDHPSWGLRTVVVPILQSIKNATQFTAGTYNTNIPTSTTPVNLGKSSKVTLTVRATDDTTAGFIVTAYIYDGTAWRPLSFSVSGIASSDCAATVQFTTGTDGRFYFGITGATFTAFIYTAESAP